MKKLNQKGITLIALVITIIVLLILAGVSIAMLTGQNGILTQAQNAKTANENKSAEEKVKLAIMAARSQSETGELNADKLITEVTTNYGGTAEKTIDGFPVIVTIDGKSFTVDENGTVELTSARPQVIEAKVVTNADGTGDDVANNQAEGTTLYISFKASLENGTIKSVTCDKGTVENKGGIYVTKVTENGTYTYTITGTGENGEVTSTVPIKVSKYAKVKVGDFVNYSAGTWTEGDMTKITNSGAQKAANNSTNLPNQSFQFGGFTVGSSKDGNATPNDTDYAYVKDKSNGNAVTGWRVFDVDGDSVTLISAGCPEDYYHQGSENYGYISEYILSGNVNSSATSLNLGLGTTYKPRDWSMYVNSAYGSGITATALTKTRLDQWYNKNYNLTLANTAYSNYTFQKIYGTNNESLIDNYSYYWLASADSSYSVYGVYPGRKPVSNASRYAFGVRVLVSLPSGIQTSDPVGTKTVTSRDKDYTYNVWNIQ